MQKFHSKMTPHSLDTQFHLTEITYAKVCTYLYRYILPTRPVVLTVHFLQMGGLR